MANVTRYVEFPSGSNSVTYDPRTGDTSLLGKVGPVELKYRLTRLDSAGTVLSTSPWITFAYELAALPTSTFEVRTFGWLMTQELRLPTKLLLIRP